MFDLSVLLNVEMQILFYILIGCVLKIKKVTDEHIDTFLSSFVLNLVMPVNIFLSFYKSISTEVLKSSLMLVAVGLVVAIIVIIIGKFIPHTMTEERRKIAQYSILISNGSLIGLPLIQGLFGNSGVFYANIFMIPTRILAFSSGEKYFNPEYKGVNGFTVIKKFMLNPITLAMIFGFVFNLFAIPIPGGINSVFEGLSSCMTPIALILVGSTLVGANQWSQNTSINVVGISFFKLIIAPFLTFVICCLFQMNMTMTMVAVLINAAPVASTATIFAQKYNGDAAFSSNCVFMSTLFSFATLWLIFYTMVRL